MSAVSYSPSYERRRAFDRGDLHQFGLRTIAYLARSLLWVQISLLLVGLTLGVFSGISPVVIEGDSMGEQIPAGHLAILRDVNDDDQLLGHVVMFERGGRFITHRVVGEAENGELLTKGDASASPDQEPLQRNEVKGVVRRIVPWIGLPVVWLNQGRYVPLVVWTAATTALVAIGWSHRLGRRHTTVGNSQGDAIAGDDYDDGFFERYLDASYPPPGASGYYLPYESPEPWDQYADYGSPYRG